MKLRAWVVVAAAVVIGAACHKKGAPEPVATSKHCASSVSAASSIAPPGSVAPLASSIVPVTLSIDAGMAKKLVESKVPTRVAAASGTSIGSLGNLSYTVDRGPFSLSIDHAGNVVATTDLAIHATVCKEVFGLGCVQYASCSPAARVTAAIPSKLTDKYRFAGSVVHLDVTKRCLVTAADIDATSFVESAASAQLPKIKAKIDGSLPDLKPDVERAWGAAQTTVPFANACLSLHPTRLVEGPASMDHGKILLRLAVAAMPTVDLPCAGDAPTSPLPPLSYDAKLPADFELHVPVKIATPWMEEALKKKLAAEPATLDASTITAFAITPTDGALAFDAALDGETCGVARFVGPPSWDAKARAIVFTTLAAAGNSLDPSSLGAVVAMPPTVDDEKLVTSLETLAPMASEPGREIALTFASHGSEGVVVTPNGVEARFFFKGGAAVDVK